MIRFTWITQRLKFAGENGTTEQHGLPLIFDYDDTELKSKGKKEDKLLLCQTDLLFALQARSVEMM